MSTTIQSMTGYGRAVRRTKLGSVTVELRSTNHRYLEIESRLPNGLTAMQDQLTALIRHRLQRGRVDVQVSLQMNHANLRRIKLDEPLLERYYAALMELKSRFGLKGAVTLEHLLSLPQAMTITEERVPLEKLWQAIGQTVQAALQDLVRARQREGRKLLADLRRQMALIEQQLRAVRRALPKATARQRRELRARLQALLGSETSSAARLEEAVALLREADVHEELIRIDSHLSHMRQALATRQAVGKQLDFIAQELMREANTLGAKVNDAAASHAVVEIKGCIEKIREQVQNLE